MVAVDETESGPGSGYVVRGLDVVVCESYQRRFRGSGHGGPGGGGGEGEGVGKEVLLEGVCGE